MAEILGVEQDSVSWVQLYSSHQSLPRESPAVWGFLLPSHYEWIVGNSKTIPPPLLRIRIRNAEGGRVLTEFIDNGHGLPDDRADRIFDAFVSTKENGMGIGLAISRSIVEAHDGELWAANNPRFGATFSLLLKGSRASQG